MPQLVTDPDLLRELNGPDPSAAAAPASSSTPALAAMTRVTDPDILSQLNAPDGVSFAPDGAPAGLRNVPTAASDPIYHGAVPIAQAPDQGAATAFGSGVGGVPIIGPTILRGEQELAAYARSLRYGTSLDAELQHTRDMTDAARQQHPYAAFAGDFTGAATALGPAIDAAPGVFGAGGGGLTASKIGYGTLSGMGIGGADAAVRSGGDPTATIEGLAGGGLGGAAGPVLGAGFSRLGQGAADLWSRSRAPDPGISRPAAAIIRNTLANDGNLNPQGLANIGTAGPHGMLVDASPSLSGVLDTALQHGGPGAVAARQAVDARAAASGADMNASLDRAFGPPQGVLSATDALRQGSAAARDAAYRTAYASPIDYSSPAGRVVENIMSTRVPGGIIARAQRQMQMDGVLPTQQRMASIADDGTVTYHQMPDVQLVDYVTRSLNDVAKAGDGQGALGGNTSEGRSYGMLAQDLRGALRSAVPEYGTALDTAAQPIQARNALDFGASMLHPSVARDEVASTLQGMTGPELDHVRGGVRAHIADTLANVQRTITDPNVDARQTMAGVKMLSSDAAQDKLGMLLGPGEAQSISGALDQAGRSLNLRAAISRNSATAARLNANDVVRQAALPNVAVRTVTAPVDWLHQPLMQFLTRSRPQDIAAREAAIHGDLASALTSPGPGATSILDRLLQGQAGSDRASSIAGAIPYNGIAQTGIFSLLPPINQGAY